MIANSPKFLNPIDNLKVLSGQVHLTEGVSVTHAPPGVPVTGSSFNFVQTVCNKCKKFAPIGGPQIDGIVVCQSCFEEHQVIDNTLPCPYKDPKRRKYTVKAKNNGPLWSYTTTQANT